MGAAPVTVLFVAGADRSGTTLISRLLGAADDCVAVGELLNVWDRGLTRNELCGCGEPFRTCSFWNGVVGRALPRIRDRGIEVEQLLAWSAQIRLCEGIAVEHIGALVDPAARDAYAFAYAALYEAIRDVAGARVVVDSSKVPAQAMAVAHDPRLHVQATHIVRDSRGVVYSLGRTRARPEVHWAHEEMTRLGTVAAAKFWLKLNVQCERLARAQRTTVRTRYEAVLADPTHELGRLLAPLGVSTQGIERSLSGAGFAVERDHSVSGNPMRFESGAITLKPDDEWRARMAPRDFALATVLTAPLLRRYGYRLTRGRVRDGR